MSTLWATEDKKQLPALAPLPELDPIEEFVPLPDQPPAEPVVHRGRPSAIAASEKQLRELGLDKYQYNALEVEEAPLREEHVTKMKRQLEEALRVCFS